MLKSLSNSLILRGLLALAIGIMALAWPGVTVFALVVMFAVFAFMGAGFEAVRAFNSRTAGPVFGHLLLAVVDVAAGVIALVWPVPTALVLVLLIGSWAVGTGVIEIVSAFRMGEAAGTLCPVYPRWPGLGGIRGRALRSPGHGRCLPCPAVRPVQPRLGQLDTRARDRVARHRREAPLPDFPGRHEDGSLTGSTPDTRHRRRAPTAARRRCL